MKKINCPNCGMELIPWETEDEELIMPNNSDTEVCIRQFWCCTKCGCEIETFNPIRNEE